MRVIVTGSRGWTDRSKIAFRLSMLIQTTPPEKLKDGLVIVVGYDPEARRPKGVDELAYQEAQKLGLDLDTYPAYWNDHGKRAGFIRNDDMAKAGAALCIAFWDGRSTGTLDMITRAVKHNIPVDVVMQT